MLSMEDEGDRTLSPKKRATKELEDAFIAALDKIKDLDQLEEQESDLQVDDTKLDPKQDLQELDTKEVESEKIKKETENGLNEEDKVEIYKKLTQLRGIGQKTAEKLVEFGITSIEDIAELEVDMIPETLDISTKSFRTAIKNARKHLEKEIEDEKPGKAEEITSDLHEEISVEATMSIIQKEDSEEASASELNNKELIETPERAFKDKTLSETLKSDWKVEIDQFIESIKEDIRFFYDEMTRFHDTIAEMRSGFHTLKKEMNQIDEKLSEILIKNVKSDIDIVKTKIVELQNEDFSKVTVAETKEPTNTNEDQLTPISPTQVKAKSESKKKTKKAKIKISFDEIVHRLNTVGLIRGTSEPYFTICEILVEQDTQEMNYDALFMKSQLPPQTFSQIIFDLSTKKILDFDAKTDIVSIRTSK
jgi:predicted flap endonuclease-1-like 5' DNA nuclease